MRDRKRFGACNRSRGNKFVAAFTRDLYSSLALRERRERDEKDANGDGRDGGERGARAERLMHFHFAG